MQVDERSRYEEEFLAEWSCLLLGMGAGRARVHPCSQCWRAVYCVVCGLIMTFRVAG